MILGNRRLRLLYVALAGMDMAVLLPWFTNIVIFWARNGDARVGYLQSFITQSPLLLFIIFWVTMQLYMLVADLFTEWNLSPPLYALSAVIVLVVTSLLSVRILLYPELAPGDFLWLHETFFSLFNLIAGIRGEILLILTNYFLWMRVARYTDRGITFFGVGLSFRLGMLLIIAGSTLLSYWSGENQAAILYLILFFAFGLCAVALARIDQKAVGTANSSGAILPWDRFTQLWVSIVAIVGAGLAAATVYTPTILRMVLGWFSPIGTLFEWIFTGITFLMFLILSPFLNWLAAQLRAMMAEAQPMQLQEGLPTPAPLDLNNALQDYAMLRYCIGGAIVLVALVMLLMLFVRVTRRDRKAEPEDTASEGSLRPGPINFGLDRLRDWFALLGRYGLGSQLLAAISVENIYANLGRMARRKGFPRQPSQGPDRYLPVLEQAFPGHEEALGAITNAYVRVRYAERPITAVELESLRASYTAIVTSEENGKAGNSAQRAAT